MTQIDRAVTVIKKIGPSRTGQVRAHMAGMRRQNVTEVLNRAVDKGLLIVEGEKFHRVYSIPPDKAAICSVWR